MKQVLVLITTSTLATIHIGIKLVARLVSQIQQYICRYKKKYGQQEQTAGQHARRVFVLRQQQRQQQRQQPTAHTKTRTHIAAEQQQQQQQQQNDCKPRLPRLQPPPPCCRESTSGSTAQSSSSSSSDTAKWPSFTDDSVRSLSSVEDRDQQPLLQHTRSAACCGTLSARIIPSKCLDYNRQKPNAAATSSSSSSKLQEIWESAMMLKKKKLGTFTRESCLDVDDCHQQYPKDLCCQPPSTTLTTTEPGQMVVLTLEMDLVVAGLLATTTTTTSTKKQDGKQASTSPQVLSMHLHRDAQEPATRTLRRLELSASRKALQQIATNEPRGTQISNNTRSRRLRRQERTDSSSDSQANNATTAVIWTNDQDGSSEGEGGQEDDEESDWQDLPYKRISISSSMQSADLWKDLGIFSSKSKRAILSFDVAKGAPPVSLWVDACPPTITSVKTFESFKADVFVGIPLVIEAQVVHASRAAVSWFVDEQMVLMDSPCYTPVEADIGKFISVLIVPIRPGHIIGGGGEESYQYQRPVQALPDMTVVHDTRSSWTTQRRWEENDDQDLRVLSYNILADLYTSRETDQELMYNHCNPKFLARSRRMPLLVYEILAYQADVICLQEVDAYVYESLLRPVLECQGKYQGYYSNKASAQLEGCAMFFSLRRFERIGKDQLEEFALRDLLMTMIGSEGMPTSSGVSAKNDSDSWDTSSRGIERLLSQHAELRRVAQNKVGQVLQIATLQLRSSSSSQRRRPKQVVVGNTHLFYHPMADHIRAIQAYTVCRQLDMVRRRCHHSSALQQQQQPLPPLVLCGDFNSSPLSGSLHLLLQRELKADHFETWRHLHDYAWEMGDHEFMLEHGYVGNTVESSLKSDPIYENDSFEDAKQELEEEESCENALNIPNITLPASFPDLVLGYPRVPVFTNYAVDFIETLDYILASKPSSSEESFGFVPKRAAPIPSMIDMKKYYVAMPNEFMPSDHVSLVCDLEWKTKNSHHDDDDDEIINAS